MLLRTLTENNVLFYDENNYNDFLYDVSQGFYHDDISQESSSTDAHFVCNIGIMLANIAKWNSFIPKVKINYKVHANCNHGLIRILRSCGIQFSVSTSDEIINLVNLGIEPTSLLYNGSVKYIQHIVEASIKMVDHLSVITVNELERIVLNHPNAKLLLHVSAIDDRFIRLLNRATELGATIEGLCYDFPDNSNEHTEGYYEECFSNLGSIVRYLSSNYNISINLINLGSEIPLFEENETSSFQRFTRCVNQFTYQFESIKMIAEPMSLIFDNANQLCCNVMGIRHLHNAETKRKNMFYYLNDGIYGSLSNTIYHGYVPNVEILQRESILTMDSKSQLETYHSTFWGPTCDSMDKICTVKEFSQLFIGDTVTFKNVGLYNISCATNFNGFNIPKIRFIFSYQKLEALGIADTTNSEVMTKLNNAIHRK